MLAYIPYMDPMGTDMYFNVPFFSSVVGRHGPATHRLPGVVIPPFRRPCGPCAWKKKRLGLQLLRQLPKGNTPSARVKTQFVWMYI